MTTDNPFWVYIKTDKLIELLKEWSLSKQN